MVLSGLVIVLLVVVVLVFFLWNTALDEPGIEKSCVDINNAKSYSFDACYNARSQITFLTLRRNSYDVYNLVSIKASLFDSSSKEYNFSNIPAKGSSLVYQLGSDKNPKSIYLDLGVEKDYDGSPCIPSRRVFVKDCDEKSPQITNNNPIREIPQVDLRTHLLELKSKEESWKNICSSTWNCSSWGICEGGIQKRLCSDTKNCLVSTSTPDTVRYCSEACIEDWDCSWSSCKGGMSIPSCLDKNRCGTTDNMPQTVDCSIPKECTPDISCTNWTLCSVDYQLVDVESSSLATISGTRSRVCSDKNSCIGSVRETANCSVGVDVYTQKYSKCNTNYVDIYDKLDNQLIARIDKGNEQNPYMNIKLDAGSNEQYCDSCYNGLLDGDELRIDCGGSCQSCDKKYGPINLLSDSVFAKVGRLFRGIFG